MASSPAKTNAMTICLQIFILLCALSPTVFASTSLSPTVFASTEQCNLKSMVGCHDTRAALKLKIVAIASILVTSMVGVCLPLFTHFVPALRPEKALFSVVKALASGVILATGYMHVLPDSFACLTSPCLPRNPWRKFPFTAFVAMLSAVATLMVDSFAMSYYKKIGGDSHGHGHGHGSHGSYGSSHSSYGSSHGGAKRNDVHVENGSKDLGDSECPHDTLASDEKGTVLLRHRVVAQVLELGIVVHSVVIGLSMGASDNPCTIRPLIAALCFHQLFEGMGLGGCILQAEYAMKMKVIMVFFFSATTPFGIAMGIGLSNIYSANSPTALIVVGLLNASSAGLLNYMALVDLLAADFMGPKLQENVRLQLWAYAAVLLGAGGMSVMAIWA
ncbi:Fe(2+) transport protein 2 [Turnera subulata]|uniref:Fe(2+) transport protein 2 n=1 Tax=Turnera subulata TaxID=218843 RepID=A0A9Q0JNC2_9ROSI|nr:Fe(2+) transport protein 2 [Turnera subulata]